jgi:DNA polymerase V|nr:translesion error-prone DNA polymerase V autoproteolytic subunit [Pantoea brenneri]
MLSLSLQRCNWQNQASHITVYKNRYNFSGKLMSASFTLQLAADEPQDLALPLFLERVPAGFPSPAQDYVESELNLHQYCVKHPAATFFLRASGNSMTSAGMRDGDLLVIDRAVTPEHGDTIVATADGEFIVRQLQLRPRLALRSLTPPHQAIYINPDELDIFGVVTHFIHSTRSK